MTTIIDSIMGSGKTTWAIAYMNDQMSNKQKRFIFATPFLSEDDRIKRDCPKLSFIEPDGKYSKQADFKKLIADGKNIATTHALLRGLELNDTDQENLKRWNYTLILDEVIDIISPVDRLNEDDCRHLIEDGMIEIEASTDRVNWITDTYPKRYNDIAQLAEAGRLHLFRNCQFFDIMPIETFKAMPNLIIMTFLFEASHLYHYFEIHQIPWKKMYIREGRLNQGDADLTEEKERFIRSIILYDGRLNEIGNERDSLSATFWKMNKNRERRKRVLNNTRTFFKTRMDAPAERCMWSAFRNEHRRRQVIVPGYVTSFVPFNARAVNEHKQRDCLAYLVNVYENPLVAGWFEKQGSRLDSDQYALSSMLQWIWRSAIRDGNKINLYLPSKRMRRILFEWLHG